MFQLFSYLCNTIKIKGRNYDEHFQHSFNHPHIIWNDMFNNWDNSDGCSKEKGKHTEWGEIYHASYVVITITAIILSIINWDKIAYLFYVAIFSYSFAIYGYLARKTLEKLAPSPH